jgi:hypothetical protein
VKRYGKYGWKASRILIRSGQYGRKLWNDMENVEEKSVEKWKNTKKYGRKVSWIMKRYGN